MRVHKPCSTTAAFFTRSATQAVVSKSPDKRAVLHYRCTANIFQFSRRMFSAANKPKNHYGNFVAN
jgi:hypothetical protein